MGIIRRDRRQPDAATEGGAGSASFLRGLTAGALVGAAIAGSAIWQRRRARPAGDAAVPGEADSMASADGDRPA